MDIVQEVADAIMLVDPNPYNTPDIEYYRDMAEAAIKKYEELKNGV